MCIAFDVEIFVKCVLSRFLMIQEDDIEELSYKSYNSETCLKGCYHGGKQSVNEQLNHKLHKFETKITSLLVIGMPHEHFPIYFKILIRNYFFHILFSVEDEE